MRLLDIQDPIDRECMTDVLATILYWMDHGVMPWRVFRHCDSWAEVGVECASYWFATHDLYWTTERARRIRDLECLQALDRMPVDSQYGRAVKNMEEV